MAAMARPRLIVNADGLGRTPEADAAVVAAHAAGIVTSASLVVAGRDATRARPLAEANPRLAVGLHLQLTGEAPVLGPQRLATLVGRSGRLPPAPEGLLDADPAEVLAEARAQLDRFRELLGRDPTHFDSRDDAHRLPPLFAAVVALARETGRPVRRAGEELGPLLRREGIASTDRLEECPPPSAADALARLLRRLPQGTTTELRCRPASLAALASPALGDALRAGGIKLVSWAEL